MEVKKPNQPRTSKENMVGWWYCIKEHIKRFNLSWDNAQSWKNGEEK